ncbi:MAG: hypothetical protein ACRDIE_18125, partial [Chloroflexota bacterium]
VGAQPEGTHKGCPYKREETYARLYQIILDTGSATQLAELAKGFLPPNTLHYGRTRAAPIAEISA